LHPKGVLWHLEQGAFQARSQMRVGISDFFNQGVGGGPKCVYEGGLIQTADERALQRLGHAGRQAVHALPSTAESPWRRQASARTWSRMWLIM